MGLKPVLKKVIEIYHADRLAGLTRRILAYGIQNGAGMFRAFFLPKRDVLYVSGCPGGSMFYRCTSQKEELEKFGITSSIFSQHSPFLDRLIKKHDMFIFQRVVVNPHTQRFLEKIKKANKLAIYETDDLVFDPDYIRYMAYYKEMGDEERTWYDNGIGRELLEDVYVRHVVVSTHVLKQAVLAKYPEKSVFISSNKLSSAQVAFSRQALKRARTLRPDDGKVRIGYFSGSKSHDRDFDVVKDVLIEMLEKDRRVMLMIVGYLTLADGFDQFRDRIERFEFVPLDRYYDIMIRADINIAPLELDNPFCQAKSALKFFEAGLLRIPTVATATQPFESTVTNHVDGFIAHRIDQWAGYLDCLVSDDALRKRMGNEAYNTICKHHTISGLSGPSDFVRFVKQQLTP